MGWRGDWCPLKRGYTGACREEKQPSLGIDPSRWRHWASPVTVGASPQRHCPPPWGWVSAGLDEGRLAGRESPASAGVPRDQASLPGCGPGRTPAEWHRGSRAPGRCPRLIIRRRDGDRRLRKEFPPPRSQGEPCRWKFRVRRRPRSGSVSRGGRSSGVTPPNRALGRQLEGNAGAASSRCWADGGNALGAAPTPPPPGTFPLGCRAWRAAQRCRGGQHMLGRPAPHVGTALSGFAGCTRRVSPERGSAWRAGMSFASGANGEEPLRPLAMEQICSAWRAATLSANPVQAPAR